MIDFKYQICVTKKEKSKPNPVNNMMDGCMASIEILEIGIPLFGYYMPKDDTKPHRFFTTPVLNFVEKEDGNIFIETENTFYKFKKLV